MRSRYSAYVLGLEDYLRATWHPVTCPATLDLDVAPRPQWLGLTVKSFRPIDDTHATVEFVARYKINGRAQAKMLDAVWPHLKPKLRCAAAASRP